MSTKTNAGRTLDEANVTLQPCKRKHGILPSFKRLREHTSGRGRKRDSVRRHDANDSVGPLSKEGAL